VPTSSSTHCLGEVVIDTTVHSAAGTVAHLLVAEACSSEHPTGFDLIGAANRMLRERSDLGVLRGSVRLAAVTAAGVYLTRWRPVSATLSAVEFPLGRRVADLVWELSDGTVVVDELKTGLAVPGLRDTRQCVDMCAAGVAVWGGCFGGVRLIYTSRPADCVWFGSTTPAGLSASVHASPVATVERGIK
jgi:hypothetical protein